MDKMTFASYKFKPSDVIEGLNRYFAESKAFRYRRVPLEIHNGTVKPGNYYVFRNIVFDVTTPKIKELGYYYLICDPEEVAGVAINWLWEEHDIFYTLGMEAPIDDFDVYDAAKEYEKATRTSDIFCEEKLDVVPVVRVREALGISEDSDIFECVKYRNHQLEILRTELAVARRMYHKAIEEKDQWKRKAEDTNAGWEADRCLTNRLLNEQRDFITKVAEILDVKNPYIESEYTSAISKLRATVAHPNRYKWLYENLKDGMESVLQEAEEKED